MKRAILAIAGCGFLAAVIWWNSRDPRGPVVATSLSPDGKWHLVVREKSPTFPSQSPYDYTFSLSRSSPDAPVSEFLKSNDSAAIGDFRCAWTSAKLTVYWSGKLSSISADLTIAPSQWGKVETHSP